MATLHGDDRARGALEELCRRYWQPVFSVVRSREPSVEAARDRTQAFFLHLLERSTLRRADRSRGRFRTFLLTVLWRFLRDEQHRDVAEKRGGTEQPRALDDVEDELAGADSPLAEELDREWALTTMERAMELLREEVTAARGQPAWEILRGFLPGSTNVPSMPDAARVLGLSEAGARTEIHRLRRRCRDILRRLLLGTVNAPEDVDAEIEHLGRALRGALAAR